MESTYKKLNLLLIEDNIGDVRLIQEMLREIPEFRLINTGSLSSAFEYLNKNKTDIVLLDLGLPDSQGLDTVIKVVSKMPLLAIIVLTGLKDDEMALKSLNVGAQDYLVKGKIDPYLLRRSIHYSMERKHSELVLRESRQSLEMQYSLLTALINSPSDIIIFSLDKNYFYTTFNENHREEMKRVWNADIRIGMNLLELMTIPELKEAAKNTIDRVLRGEIISDIQHQPEPDTYYNFRWNPVFQDKEVVGVTVFISDITKRERAEEEIRLLNAELEKRVILRTAQFEVANKELEAFSYSVSHDLRAPLRHISGYVELLTNRFKKELPEKGQHYLDEISDSIHQMGLLIDDLLQFSRTGRMELNKADSDMNWIVQEVVELLRHDNPDRFIESNHR